MISRAVFTDCQVFKTLGDGDVQRIADISTVEEHAAGSTVFREGTPSEKLYLLQNGKVALQMQLPSNQAQAGRRVSVDIVTQNEVFGWSALVEPHRYTLMAVCLEPTKVVAIDAFKLRSMMDGDQRVGYELLRQIIRVLASRLEESRHVLVSERLGSA